MCEWSEPKNKENTHHHEFCTRDVDRRFCGGGAWISRLDLFLAFIRSGQFMNFSQAHSGTKVQCESCLFSQGKTPEFTKMGEIHELFVLALSLVWFAGATPDFSKFRGHPFCTLPRIRPCAHTSASCIRPTLIPSKYLYLLAPGCVNTATISIL